MEEKGVGKKMRAGGWEEYPETSYGHNLTIVVLKSLLL